MININAYNKKRINSADQIFSYENLLKCYYEIGLMTDKKFGIAQKEMEEIGKMIGGWKKWAG